MKKVKIMSKKALHELMRQYRWKDIKSVLVLWKHSDPVDGVVIKKHCKNTVFIYSEDAERILNTLD